MSVSDQDCFHLCCCCAYKNAVNVGHSAQEAHPRLRAEAQRKARALQGKPLGKEGGLLGPHGHLARPQPAHRRGVWVFLSRAPNHTGWH